MPPNNPFYTFIEVAYAHGVISGYADGTFHPYSDVTRAQLAKMIVVARGLPLLTPATPTYRDVPAQLLGLRLHRDGDGACHRRRLRLRRRRASRAPAATTGPKPSPPAPS